MENINIWCWLIPAVVGIVCAYFGYLLGKGKDSGLDNSEELKSLKNKNSQLEAALLECNKSLSQKSHTIVAAEGISQTPKAEAKPSFDAAAAKSIFGKAIKQDDLKLVEGIGPKIQELFYSFKIKTWKDLSETSVDKCHEVLLSGEQGTKCTILPLGPCKRKWPMKANGKNYTNGRKSIKEVSYNSLYPAREKTKSHTITKGRNYFCPHVTYSM